MLVSCTQHTEFFMESIENSSGITTMHTARQCWIDTLVRHIPCWRRQHREPHLGCTTLQSFQFFHAIQCTFIWSLVKPQLWLCFSRRYRYQVPGHTQPHLGVSIRITDTTVAHCSRFDTWQMPLRVVLASRTLWLSLDAARRCGGAPLRHAGEVMLQEEVVLARHFTQRLVEFWRRHQELWTENNTIKS